MRFAASIHCMDGRIQEPIIAYIKRETGVDVVDAITEAGPVGLLAGGDEAKTASVVERLQISAEAHGATQVFVSAHHDCAGNPVDKSVQIDHVRQTVELLRPIFPGLTFHGLWIDETFKVMPLDTD